MTGLPELNRDVCPYCREPVTEHHPRLPLDHPRYICAHHGPVQPMRRVALFPTGAWEVRYSE